MKKYFFAIAFAALAFTIFSCSKDDDDPNVIGGDTNLDYTKVGHQYSSYISIDGISNSLINDIKDTIVVTSSSGGIVKYNVTYAFDTSQTKALDTTFGVSSIPKATKLALINTYLKRYGATLDTSNKNHMTLKGTITAKVTSEGIQDFFYGDGGTSRPFTIIKYNASVGDKYEFTTSEGKTITREVVSHSTTDDYWWVNMYIKVFKVDEVQSDDILVDKITYVSNHKFGLVGIKVTLKNGKVISVGLF